jgi:hypothetical protein
MDLHIHTLARQDGAEVVWPFSTALEAQEWLLAHSTVVSQQLPLQTTLEK